MAPLRPGAAAGLPLYSRLSQACDSLLVPMQRGKWTRKWPGDGAASFDLSQRGDDLAALAASPLGLHTNIRVGRRQLVGFRHVRRGVVVIGDGCQAQMPQPAGMSIPAMRKGLS